MTGPRSSVFTSVRRPPRRRWWRGVKVTLVVILVVALLMGAVVGAVWAESMLRLGGQAVPALADDADALGDGEPRAPDDATTVLVALVEQHDPTAPRPAPLAGPVALVQVAEGREDTAVVALPRELTVTVEDEGSAPLDEVHQAGGLDLLVRAVVDYTGVRVDHAVSASLDALPRLTDSLGGVERCGSSGCRELDADAVRAELATDDDAERVRAAGEVVQALGAHVDATTPIRHPLRSRSVIGALSDEIRTDRSLRGTGLLEVAEALATPRPLQVMVLPGVRNPETGQLRVSEERAVTLFQHLQQGTPLEGGAGAEENELLPEEIAVGVLNGTGTAGLAGRIESQLEGAGFAVAGTDNATSFDHDQTTVAYAEDDADAEIAAILIARALEDAALQPTTSPLSIEGERVDVQVTIGADLDDGDEDGD